MHTNVEYSFGVIRAIVIIAFSTSPVSAYPGGAPDVACASMFPTGHHTDPQTSPAPFHISVSKLTYAAGETLQVVLSAEDGEYFRGIYVQARSADCARNISTPFGTFTYSYPDLQTRHCFGHVHSALTHASDLKKHYKVIYWTAPVNAIGHIVFRATFVQNTTVFWTDVYSNVVTDLKAPNKPLCPSIRGMMSHPASIRNMTNVENIKAHNHDSHFHGFTDDEDTHNGDATTPRMSMHKRIGVINCGTGSFCKYQIHYLLGLLLPLFWHTFCTTK